MTKQDQQVAARYDYLPLGETLGANVGPRTTGMGYSPQPDQLRQKFTAYERDNESGLDYAQARYYSSTQGRFTSPDPLLASGNPKLPQSWNRYAYSVNNPLVNVDPSGLLWYTKNGGDGHPEWFDDDPGDGYTRFTQYSYYAGEDKGYVALDQYSNNYQIGFDTLEEARSYSKVLADETLRALDPGQDVSLLEGALEMSMYISVVTGTVRVGIALTGKLVAREATTTATEALAETATRATIHGAEQLAARGFTEADIALTKTGVQFLQRDGASVFLKEVAPGKYNVIVEGTRGVVTALKNISEKSAARLAQNYGWYSPLTK